MMRQTTVGHIAESDLYQSIAESDLYQSCRHTLNVGVKGCVCSGILRGWRFSVSWAKYRNRYNSNLCCNTSVHAGRISRSPKKSQGLEVGIPHLRPLPPKYRSARGGTRHIHHRVFRCFSRSSLICCECGDVLLHPNVCPLTHCHLLFCFPDDGHSGHTW